MLFSSITFLFLFLPAVLIGNTVLRFSRKLQNVFLCVSSLFFYAWGGPVFVLVLAMSILVNWIFGIVIDRMKKTGRDARPALFAAAALDLAVLFVFQYLGFTISNINALTGLGIHAPDIAVPMGVSFFTFQAISYVADVYRGKCEAQKSVLNVALYLSFFPQLIAGPIVRYETIAEEIEGRKETYADLADGIMRFMIGMGKKVIISQNLALVADKAFELSSGGTWFGAPADLSVLMAWLGSIAYTFQIYYDFSGYSDMALGLGRMFGFHFDENFNYPYIADSVTDFWRRWHISLSSWFRDYVYIPIGGSRAGSNARLMFNLFFVWLLTGIWHGANWTFIVWGMLYFVLIAIERRFPRDEKKHGLSSVLRHVYVMFWVNILWTVFRSDDLGMAMRVIGKMFSFGGTLADGPSLFYLRQYWVFFLLAALFSAPVIPKLAEYIGKRSSGSVSVKQISETLEAVIAILVFAISVSYIVMGSYNPFIYFNF